MTQSEHGPGAAPPDVALLEIDCVIPTHGRPDFLAESLRSVLDQTLPPRRVYVVSDDADPRSEATVSGFRTAHPTSEITFVTRTTGGPGASASRNLGARHGSAPLIAFLDDDDLWEPDYLRAAVTSLEGSDLDAVVTAFRRFSVHGDGAVRAPARGLTARDVFRTSPGVTGSTIVIRRTAFERLRGFDPALPVQNDRDFFLRLVAAEMTYAVVPEPLTRVRDHGDGRLTDASLMRADGILAFLHKHGAAFPRSDRRAMRYIAHRTRLSAATTHPLQVASALRALASWSPSAARQLPLGLGQRLRRTGPRPAALRRAP